MSFDLTLKNYCQLCNVIVERQTDCRVMSHLENERDDGLIVRHDVDRNPERALRMATLENELGIRAAYYFPSTKKDIEPERETDRKDEAIGRMPAQGSVHYV